jgi:signal recognition particle subunit SEC65
MTGIVDAFKYPTAKSLKEAIKEGKVIYIQDPSIMNPRYFSTLEMQRGEKVVVTNHPKRSYFVAIEKTVDGVIRVVK